MSKRRKKEVFGSFADLQRARGETPAEPEPEAEEPEDRGWSLVGTGEEAPDLDALPEAAMDERIARRPPAFAPMDTGPACYHVEDSEEMQLLASFRIRTVFPEDVRAEVQALPRDPRPADLEGRLDLRDRTIFTIDGEDARDFDDAIGIENLGDGNLEIGVHIADVGHYVAPGTALDAEALARGTSVYLADQVVPMLPEELSNHLCSLVEGRDRLAYSVFMVFDGAGRRIDARVAKSVICSVRRNTYRGVQELLDRQDTEQARRIRDLEAPLRLFQEWTKKQQAIRDSKGSLRIQSVEKKFLFDDQHEVRAVVDAPRYFSMSLIEETALAANQAVGDLFRERGLPTIYRVHPEKSPEEIAAVARMLAQHNVRVPRKHRLTGRDIGRLIRAVRRRPNAEAMIQRIMGLVERATYEVRDHEDVATHFGLAREAYLHFTSPIRRYPDLVVHRWLWAVESRGEEAASELRGEELVADLNRVAAHASSQAQVAEMAETAIADLKVCQYLHPHVGERLDATIERVSPPGMVLALQDFNVTGFLPTRAIGGMAHVKGATLEIRKGRQVRSFTEGQRVAVRLEEVDFLRLQPIFALA